MVKLEIGRLRWILWVYMTQGCIQMLRSSNDAHLIDDEIVGGKLTEAESKYLSAHRHFAGRITLLIERTEDIRRLPYYSIGPLSRYYMELCEERAGSNNDQARSYRLRFASMQYAMDARKKLVDKGQGGASIADLTKITGNSTFLRLAFKAITEELVEIEAELNRTDMREHRYSVLKKRWGSLRSSIILLMDERTGAISSGNRTLKGIAQPYSEGANSKFVGERYTGLQSLPESVPAKKRISPSSRG